MKRNKRKGATLAEICIVMAVVAIVSLSVTSFATMASGRGTAAATKLDAMGDLELVEAIVESWIFEATKNPENVISIDPKDKAKIMATNDNPIARGSIMFDRQTLNVTFPGVDDAVLYRLKSIVGLEFSRVRLMEDGSVSVDEVISGETDEETSENAKAVLYYCTVTYQYRNGLVTKDQTYTFCVYPRAGEIVGGTNENADDNTNDNADNAGDITDNENGELPGDDQIDEQ